jgi:hypothetical protein
MTPETFKQKIEAENITLKKEFPELRNKEYIEFKDIERAKNNFVRKNNAKIASMESQLAELKAKLAGMGATWRLSN